MVSLPVFGQEPILGRPNLYSGEGREKNDLLSSGEREEEGCGVSVKVLQIVPIFFFFFFTKIPAVMLIANGKCDLGVYVQIVVGVL